MKTLYTLILIALIYSSAFAQNQSNNFQNDYQTFLENQKTPLLTADDDGFLIEGLPWRRLYGEKEYYLSPMTQNISAYSIRIGQSKFHFINVEVTSLSKSVLNNMNVTVPDYINEKVNIYLPEIDIDVLNQNNIAFTSLTNYGTQKFSGGQTPTPQATIFSDGFETNPFPGTDYTITNFGSSCGWGEVSCTGFPNSGAWCLWSAKTGTSCNSACTNYINSMDSYVDLNAKSISAYMNVVFTYWRYTCINGGTADYLTRWSSFDGNSTWSLDGSVYGTDPDDCGTWQQRSTNVPPSSPYYGVSWRWLSDGSFTDGGAWLDDFALTGTVNGVDDIALNNSIHISPNPSNGIFSVQQTDKIQKLNFSITNILGEKVFETKTFNIKTEVDISNQPNGIYFLKINSENGTATKKIIINK